MVTAVKTKKKKKSGLKKALVMFRPQVRSRHPSHSHIRRILPLQPFRSIIRFGSTTDLPDTVTNGGRRVEINTISAVRNSASKKLMKTCFENHKVKTAKWASGSNLSANTKDGISFSSVNGHKELKYPIVIKLIFGSRGKGMKLVRNTEEWTTVYNSIRGSIGNYIFEEYHNYSREYRLHVTEAGCFYTCRKMLKEEAPDDARWYRNDSNCVWFVESNSKFDKPTNWDNIVSECVKALKAVGLDVGACDVRVQSSMKKEGVRRATPDFIIVEINSAPSFGEGTEARYQEILPKLLKAKSSYGR